MEIQYLFWMASMKKIRQKLVWSILVFGGGALPQIVFGLDSEAQMLNANIGAVDFFEITCDKSNDISVGDTDHLNFKLFENGGMPPVPQLLNISLIKSSLNSKVANIVTGTNNNLKLKGGNGAYTITVDTLGTNLNIKTPQNYTLLYQCLNADGLMTTGSSTLAKQNVKSITKTLANSKTAKYLVNCANNKVNGNTDSVKVTLFNNTFMQNTTTSSSNTEVAPTGTLSAQIISGMKAKNTIGTELDLQNGNGIYKVMINSPTNEAKSYHFEYSCLNKASIPTQTYLLKKLQDQ